MCIDCLGGAQGASLERQVTAIVEVEAQNRAALIEYTWQEEDTIMLDNKFQQRRMFQVQMGPDGRIERISLDLPEEKLPGEQTNGGIRDWLKQKKEQTLQKYAKELKELAEAYAHASSDLLQSAFRRGDVSVQPTKTGDAAQLQIRNYVKSDDSVILAVDPKSHELQSLEASSYLAIAREPVQISVKFSRTEDGPDRIEEITAADKKRKLLVSIHNLAYERRPSR